jgi:hypothetical protein
MLLFMCWMNWSQDGWVIDGQASLCHQYAQCGVDEFSLQKLMGLADLQVLRRYSTQTTEDIAQAH